ncbi:hypothetical protein MycrhDRAFT_6594 [Mycolicibacterium rhodesiae JS60]|nr:hypothetical protein MycrhDRAFT_6594 [Mycolicibacterium rhodesiae JS60]
MIRYDFEDLFGTLAEACLGDHVTRSTMMGLPCLRIDGRFFAAIDRRDDALLVKLPASRVDELLTTGQAHAFAPAGRRFREWAAIGVDLRDDWPELLREALAFVKALPG